MQAEVCEGPGALEVDSRGGERGMDFGMAGIELLSYAAGPPTGQLRSGAVAAVTSVRFSMTSGGLACVAAVAAVVAALPAFRAYTRPV